MSVLDQPTQENNVKNMDSEDQMFINSYHRIHHTCVIPGQALPNVCNVTTLATFLSVLDVAAGKSNTIFGPCKQIQSADSTDKNYDLTVIGDGDAGPAAPIGPAEIANESQPKHSRKIDKISPVLRYILEWYSTVSGNKLRGLRDVASLNDDIKIVMSFAIAVKIITA